MDIHLQRIVSTPHGVYQPRPYLVDALLFSTALAAIMISLALGKLALVAALLYLAILFMMVGARAYEYRKHGRLGKPSVALLENTLILAQPNDTRGDMHLELRDFEKLVIYGPIGRRRYRFVRQDHTYIEAAPIWEQRMEAAIVQFLQDQLPPSIQVEVNEPQTLFAFIRGDGP
jgi:hypothetical protein